MKRFLLPLFLVMALLPGCKQFDDGPLLSLYSVEKRIAGNWYFDRVLYGGRDSTTHYTFQRIDFIYVKEMDGGVFTWNHNFAATTWDPDMVDGGIWTLYSDRDSIEFAFIDIESQDTTYSRWRINRCAYTEFWLERTVRDTLKIEWLLWKWAM
jgi:hypothetical protein